MSADAPKQGHPVIRGYGWCTPEMHGAEPYREFCRAADLPPAPDGYGLLLFVGEHGERWTLATTDVRYVCLLHHGLQATGPLTVTLPPGKFPHVRDGWLTIPPPR